MSTYITGKSKLDIEKLEAPDFLKDFLHYCVVMVNMTPRSVISYYNALRDFLRWVACHDEVDDLMNTYDISEMKLDDVRAVDTGDIHKYLSFCAYRKENVPTTRALKLTAVRRFYTYYTATNPQLDENPAAHVTTPRKAKPLPKYLQKDEAVALLAAVAGSSKNRDYCIITWLLNCGMRLSELVGINMEDIRDRSLTLRGKGRKERIVYLNDACIVAYDDYLADRGKLVGETEKALFISPRTGRRLTARRVEQIVEDCLKRAGLSGKGYSPHKLRHTSATLLYQSGNADILTLKTMLGHASISTTELYSHLDNTSVNEAMAHSPLVHERQK